MTSIEEQRIGSQQTKADAFTVKTREIESQATILPSDGESEAVANVDSRRANFSKNTSTYKIVNNTGLDIYITSSKMQMKILHGEEEIKESRAELEEKICEVRCPVTERGNALFP